MCLDLDERKNRRSTVAINLNIAGEDVTFYAERCAYWARQRTLIMSDLHWGKSEALQTVGIPMPSNPLAVELEIISSMIHRTGAQCLLILGDLMHSGVPLPKQGIDLVNNWRQRPDIAGIDIKLLRGNHDRFLRLPDSWRIEDFVGNIHAGPFLFSHAPTELSDPGTVCWFGHVHPVIELRSRRDFIRTPCFVVSRKSILLPAFGLTTGGYAVKKRLGEKILAIAGDKVLEIQ